MRNKDTPMVDLQQALNELSLSSSLREEVIAYVLLLKEKDIKTWEHSIRVGLLARRIAGFMHLDEKALFYAGIFHDIGKLNIQSGTLAKTEGWTADDAAEMEKHVIDGHYLISGKFAFTAEVILLHHCFQKDGYPKELPVSLCVSNDTKEKIVRYGRVLALADCFDALHRVNEKFGAKKVLTGEQIREQILALNNDQYDLVEKLYCAGILI